MVTNQTIPDAVLDRIVAHRPHLAGMVQNILRNPACASQIEKHLADNYLMGETRLSVQETYALSFCCVSQPYGGKRGQA